MRPRGLIAVAIALVASLTAYLLLTSTFGAALQAEGVSSTSLGCEPSPGAQIAGIATPYTCVDVGFRPDPDGFSFANWGQLHQDDSITTQTLVSLFGAENVCVLSGRRKACTPRPAAVRWAAQLNELLANGRCEGLSVAAQRFFTNPYEVSSLDPDSRTAGELDRLTPHLVESINYWWATQMMPEVAGVAAATRNLQPSVIVADLVAGLRDGSANTVGIYAERGGHALTPFAVTYDMPWFSIWVYDSNQPGAPGRILVDPATEQWHYQATPGPNAETDEGWTGSGPGGLEYTPMSVRMRDFTAPFSDRASENDFAYILIASSPDPETEVDLRLTGEGIDIDTSQGRSASDQVIVDEISDDNGFELALVVYVRPSVPLTIQASVNAAGKPLRISIDGPALPWQEFSLVPPATGPIPLTIGISNESGTTATVASGLTVTADYDVYYDDPREQLVSRTVAGPGEIHVPSGRELAFDLLGMPSQLS